MVLRRIIFFFCIMLLAVTARAEIVTTIFSCYDLARAITGDNAEVVMLLHPGQEVHTYDPMPSDAARTLNADLIVCIGGESEEWLETLLSGADNPPQTVRLIESTETLKELDPEEDAQDEHIWTSPKNAMRMLRALEKELCLCYPEHAEVFHENADAYCAEISKIDGEIEALVSASPRAKLFFADRFPFLYLAHDYGLDFDAAFLSCTADTEPSAKRIVELIDEVRTDRIPAIYVLEMSTKNIARTIAEETGAEIVTLHSCQTVTLDEFVGGETYVTLMRKNIEI